MSEFSPDTQEDVLFVDVGNTRIKYLQGKELLLRSVDCLQQLPLTGIREVRMATVSRHAEIEGWASDTNCRVRIARVKKQHRGLTVAYPDEQRLGVDRWLAMLALWIEEARGGCVLDLGTAITVDYVSPSGEHEGGYIVPGLRLMKKSLGTETARVGFGSNSTAREPGKNTEECVDHGINQLVYAFAETIVQQLSDDYPVKITGGDAETLRSLTARENVDIDRALVLRGLRYCFE